MNVSVSQIPENPPTSAESPPPFSKTTYLLNRKNLFTMIFSPSPNKLKSPSSIHADILRPRPTHAEFECDIEAETLVNLESDDDFHAQSPSSSDYQLAVGDEASGTDYCDEPDMSGRFCVESETD